MLIHQERPSAALFMMPWWVSLQILDNLFFFLTSLIFKMNWAFFSEKQQLRRALETEIKAGGRQREHKAGEWVSPHR